MSYAEAEALAMFAGFVGIFICLIFWVAVDDGI